MSAQSRFKSERDQTAKGHTQEEIADAVGCPQETVRNHIGTLSQTVLGNQTAKLAAEHATDFEAPTRSRLKVLV